MAASQSVRFNLNEVNEKVAALHAELASLDNRRSEVIAEIESLREMQKQAAKAEIEARMKELGITVEDLGGVKRMKIETPKSSTEPKYQNPANPAETWSGRGAEPAWATAYRTSAEGAKPRTYKPEILIKP